jgi:hypothetical protein
MPADEDKRAIHRRLVERLLNGPGRAPADRRAQAFENDGLPEPPLRALVDKVATKSSQVSDADFAAATGAGFTDDELFELVICAAVGEASRRYEAGLAALAEASDEAEGG